MKQGILFIHGFTGSPQELKPLVDYLALRQPGCIHSVPTLSGHGVELTLKGMTAAHWFRDVENAYRLLAKKVDKVVVVGFSMGGMLAMYLALRYKVQKLVLLSSSLKYIDIKQLFQLSKGYLQNREDITEQQFLILRQNMYQAKKMKIPTMISFREVVQEVAPYVSKIKQPIIIVQGMKDGLVPSATAQFIYEKVASTKKKIYLSKNGTHQICYSDDRQQWFEEVFQFILQEEKEV